MIDYLIGRRVLAISSPLQKEDWTWAIELDDGIRIVNKGATKRPGNAIEGSALGTATSEGTKTRLGFYNGDQFVEAVAVPTKNIEIEYPEGIDAPKPPPEPIDPTVDLPTDPSELRVAQGPESE